MSRMAVVLSVLVMLAHAGAIIGMYYLRSVKHNSVSDTDFAVFYLPSALALATHFVVLRTSGKGKPVLPLAAQLVGSTVLSLLGLWIALFVVLNTWGA